MYFQKLSDFMTSSLTVAMTQQALLLDQTSECSCALATSCCVCGHADDEASSTTCATCVMNYYKECVETFVQYDVGPGKVSSIQCQCSQLCSKARFVKCVWQRTCSTSLARDRCRPCLPRVQFRISVGEMSQEKERDHGRESHMFQRLLFHLDSN